MTYQGHNLGEPAATLNGVRTLTGSVPIPAALPRAQKQRFFQARPVLRRVVFVAGYETLSVLFTVLVLSTLLGHGGGSSTLTAVVLSTVATGWNYLWNTTLKRMVR